MEAGRPTILLDAGQEDQKLAIPTTPRVVEVAGGDQQRGVKRSRRDRGSTAKERISKMPPCAAGKRSSIYRGVTRHRWTGRYEAHLWDKSTWNQSQNKKGKQVYLGAYDEEEAAARAYDLAALKYWGPGTVINFPLSDYARDVEEMQNVSREEYLASLRRKSSGFSRGVSKYRGVARHQHNGRWEARIGRVFGNKYLYLGTYSSQEEAAAAYDMAALEYRSTNGVANFDLSRYIRWLRPGQSNSSLHETDAALSPNTVLTEEHNGGEDEQPDPQSAEPYQLRSLGLGPSTTQKRSSSSPAALSLLLQSPMFNQMLERASTAAPIECDSMSTEPSEVSHRIDHEQQRQHVQQLNHSDEYYSPWGEQASDLHQQHQQAPPSPVEDEGSVYHSQDESTSYHRSVTSNYNYQGGIARHYGELTIEDHKQQQYPDLCHQQQQDHLAPSTTGAYDHGGYSHNSVPELYHEQESGGTSTLLEDGSWDLSSVLPLSNIVNTCGGHGGGLRSRRLLPWLGGRVIL